MRTRMAVWVSVLILLCLAMGAQGARQPFRTEALPLGELEQGLLSADEIRGVAQRYIDERALKAERLLAANPRDIIQSEIFNLYDGARAGTPRLFFDQMEPQYWAVPLQRGDRIGGFIKFDPYSGHAVGTPNWRAGGEPVYSIEGSEWEEMESIASLWTGQEFGDETRVVILAQEDGYLLYLASPRGDQIVRADVSSILSPDGLAPRLLVKAPAERPLRSFLGADNERIEQEIAKEAPAASSLPHSSMMQPDVFSLSVMPPPKDQGGYGACTGHAVSTVGDWWLCGNLCYMGTGDSGQWDCLCEKDSDGSCICIDPILSRQNAYDRLRYLGGSDCRQGLCEGGCPGVGTTCLSSLVTSGIECGTCDRCEGSSPSYAPTIFIQDGLCTEECAHYGCDPGCALSNGGSGQCTGDCPDVEGPCGDDFLLQGYFMQLTDDIPGLRDAIYYHGILLASSSVCGGQPGCDGWGSYGCLCDPCITCTSGGGHAWDFVGYNAPDSLFYFQNSWGYWGGDGRGELGNSYVRRWCSSYVWGFSGFGPSAPRLYYDEHSIDDSSGNDDGRPDPGETVNLMVTIRNVGSQADSVAATLTSSDPSAVNITDSTASRVLPVLHNAIVTFDDPFVFDVAPGAECEDITFYLNFTAAGGHAETDSFVQRIGRPELLLVDDDGGDDNEEPFQEVFAGRDDFLWDEHEVDTEGSPDGVLLAKFPVVVWLTGDATTNTVTADDTLALGEFLDGGGGLFMTGANIGQEIGSWPFYSDRLHAGFVTGTTGDYVLEGVPGSPVGDTLLICEEPSKDVIEPLADADTALVYLTMEGGVAAIAYADTVGPGATGHRLLYFGFDFGWVDDQSPMTMHKPELMDSVLTWLMLVTGVGEEPPFDPERPRTFWLRQNFPNPFGPSTTISYALPGGGERVQLRIYNIAGQLVRELVDEPQEAGVYVVDWDGRNAIGSRVSSGVYFYRLESGSRSTVRKMVVLK